MLNVGQMQEIGGYQPLERLGEGGSGVVFRALSPDGEEVALKVLHPAVAANSQARIRLQREVATINRLQIPSVVRVLDVELDGNPPFIVTELVRGFNLRSEVARQGPWQREDLADLGQRLFQTVSAMHNVGVLHRDLKPSNVMLSSSGPVLVDFGTAQIESDERITQTGLVTGTPGFVSPEVLAGNQPDRASDWWAWAATLLFCATGRAPFAGANSYAILQQVIHGQPDLAGLDDAMQYGFARALAADPAARSTPQQLLEQLNSEPGVIVPVTVATDDYPQTDPPSPHEAGVSATGAPLLAAEEAATVANPVGAAGQTQMLPETGETCAQTQVFGTESAEVAATPAAQETQKLNADVAPAWDYHSAQTQPLAHTTAVPPTAVLAQQRPVAESCEPTMLQPQHEAMGFPLPNGGAVNPAGGGFAYSGDGAVYPPYSPMEPGAQQPVAPQPEDPAPAQWQKPRMHPFLGFALAIMFTTLTLKLGVIITLIYGGCLLFAYLVGAQRRRRFQTQLNGGITLVGLPFDLIKGVFSIGGAAIIWAVVAVSVLFSGGYLQRPQLLGFEVSGLMQQFIGGLEAMPVQVRFIALLAWYLAVVLTPGLGALRGGWRVSVDTLMRPTWLRVLVTISALTIATAAAYSIGAL